MECRDASCPRSKPDETNLKRSYREVLIGDRVGVRLVYLKGDESLFARRSATRHEHFIPASLLRSQFGALEEPGPDENPIIVSNRAKIVTQILSALSIDEKPRPPRPLRQPTYQPSNWNCTVPAERTIAQHRGQ